MLFDSRQAGVVLEVWDSYPFGQEISLVQKLDLLFNIHFPARPHDNHDLGVVSAMGISYPESLIAHFLAISQLYSSAVL